MAGGSRRLTRSGDEEERPRWWRLGKEKEAGSRLTPPLPPVAVALHKGDGDLLPHRANRIDQRLSLELLRCSCSSKSRSKNSLFFLCGFLLKAGYLTSSLKKFSLFFSVYLEYGNLVLLI